jgi:ferric-dicitrate binding protein FerR (iron transport regulator)
VQRAARDPALIAGLIDRYCEAENLRWEDVANRLWIDNYSLAKLALCRRPREEVFYDDITQMASYVEVDRRRLTEFLQGAENARTAPVPVEKTPARRTERAYNRGLVWAFAVALLFLVFLGAFVLFQPKASAGTMVVLRGDVTVFKSGNAMSIVPWADGKNIASGKAAVLEAGDTVRVGENGFARLQLADGSTIDLFAGTELQASTLIINEETYQVRLNLLTGGALNRVKRLLSPGDVFEVITPSSTISVRGTVFTVRVISPEVTYVSCDEGVVEVSVGDRVVEVKAGEELIAEVGEPLNVQPQPDGNDPTPDGSIELTPTLDPLSATPTIVGTPTPPTILGEPGLEPGDDPSRSDVEPTPDDPSSENPPPGLGGTVPGDGGDPPGQGTPPGHQEIDKKVNEK